MMITESPGLIRATRRWSSDEFLPRLFHQMSLSLGHFLSYSSLQRFQNILLNFSEKKCFCQGLTGTFLCFEIFHYFPFPYRKACNHPTLLIRLHHWEYQRLKVFPVNIFRQMITAPVFGIFIKSEYSYRIICQFYIPASVSAFIYKF